MFLINPKITLDPLKIIVLAILYVVSFSEPTIADVTLEILDMSFPEACGASYNEDINTCTRCHLSHQMNMGPKVVHGNEQHLSTMNRTITSLEEKGLITVSVPAETLKPDQQFIQEIRFNGNRIMYQYGYRKVGGPFYILESQWVLGSQRFNFIERHDGISQPLLHEPGDYLFVLKLLHSHHANPGKASRWEEIVLIWTLSVEGEG